MNSNEFGQERIWRGCGLYGDKFVGIIVAIVRASLGVIFKDISIRLIEQSLKIFNIMLTCESEEVVIEVATAT